MRIFTQASESAWVCSRGKSESLEVFREMLVYELVAQDPHPLAHKMRTFHLPEIQFCCQVIKTASVAASTTSRPRLELPDDSKRCLEIQHSVLSISRCSSSWEAFFIII